MSDDPYAPPSAALQEAPGAGLKVGELLRQGLRIYLGAFPVVLLVGEGGGITWPWGHMMGIFVCWS